MITNETKQNPKFNVGDKVDFTNDYGVLFADRTIIGIEYWPGYIEPRYFKTPTDCPWYSSPERNFKLSAS